MTFSTHDAAQLARDLYPLDIAAVHALPGEYDLNFHVVDTSGASFVLKVMHPSRTLADLDLQVQALAHVSQAGVSITPAPIALNPAVGTPYMASAPDDGKERTRYIASLQAADGETRLVWMLGYLSGKVMAQVKPHTPELLRSIGEACGTVSKALADFQHRDAGRWHKWNLAEGLWISEYLGDIADQTRRALVRANVERFQALLPDLKSTRRQVIYGDANDYNLLVQHGRVSGVIDFGDVVESHPICDLAIACAYALLDKPDPVGATAQVLHGYHAAYPLTEPEIALLFPLICMRLSVSVTNSAHRKLTENDPYIVISERPAWDALEQLAAVHPRLAHYRFRAACGLPPVPHTPAVVAYLKTKIEPPSRQEESLHPLMGAAWQVEQLTGLDLSVGSLLLGANPANLAVERMSNLIDGHLAERGAIYAVGGYDEPRPIYTAGAFATDKDLTAERRTVHIGLDVWTKAGTPLYAPLAGVVEVVADLNAPQDYGPVLIMRHVLPHRQFISRGRGASEGNKPASDSPSLPESGGGGEVSFYTLYGHLAPDVLTRFKAGDSVKAGDLIAHIGAPPTNGNWPPHVHVQIITDLLDKGVDFPGVALASQREVYRSLSPDTNLLLNIPEGVLPQHESYTETLAKRRQRTGGNLSLSYSQPLKIVRGFGQYLYDDTGRTYLDLYNNVPHVGHSHPAVVEAIQKQTALLTTNTRYLHENILRYADALCAKLPAKFEVCYFVNSASEANELGLRLARAYTGQRDMIVMDTAYHGNTTGLIDISPYKFNGKGGMGKPAWVHVADVPDDYRGRFKRGEADLGAKYAAHVAELIAAVQADGRGIAGFIAESLPSVGGQIVPPAGYLSAVYDHVRAAGGVCIADEVQVGFGRLGDYFWGFELDAVAPDIVVCGKPIGNGYPLGAVITTRAIAEAFDNGMEYFSTFGGNPVACAAGLAVLDVLERERLPENAARVGTLVLDGLRGLMDKHAIIGDVRGVGFFLGVELVTNRQTLAPAARQAAYIVNRMRDRGILAGTDGPLHNVLKMRPSMIFSEREASFFLRVLDDILQEDEAQA